MSPILHMPITIFSLSIYCRMSKQSAGKHLDLTHFAYAHSPLCLSIAGCANSLTLLANIRLINRPLF